MLQLLAQRCSALTGQTSILPVLSNAKIIIDKNRISFIASDLETTIVCGGVCQSNDSFEFLWEVKNITSFCANVAENQLTIKYEPGKMLISIATINGDFEFPSEDTKDFPSLPGEIDDIEFDITDGYLDKMKIAANFTSSDQLRPSMTGVCFDIKDDNLFIVATTAHELYISEPFFLFDYEHAHQCVVPKKTITTLTSYEIKGAVKVGISATHIKFDSPNITVYARLIDAKYPDYMAITPKYENYFSVDLKTLQQNVNLVTIFSSDQTNQIYFDVKENSAEIYAINVDFSKQGKVKNIPVKNNIGTFTFSINGEKCKQVLRFLNGEAHIFSAGDAHRALIFKDKSSNDIFLIMPLMVLPKG